MQATKQPLRLPMPDENIPTERRPTVAIHASSGSSSSSPASPQQSEVDGFHGMFAKSWHLSQHATSSSSGDRIVGMVICSYSSRPLPPLFAMLAAFSDMDASASEDSETMLPNNRHAINPCPHASTAAASSEVLSTAISTDFQGSEGAQQASSKGDASMVDKMEDAGCCSGQHVASPCLVSDPDASIDHENLDMAAEQSSIKQEHVEGLRMQSSCELHDHFADKQSNRVLHHFGINEPVLMVNPDGSEMYVLLSDEQAAKEKADQMRHEREAAAIAAAKAATYWVSLYSLVCPSPKTALHSLQSLRSVLIAPHVFVLNCWDLAGTFR